MYLVVGSTGNVGGHVVAELLNSNQRVRALVRDGSRAATLPEGVETAVGDLADRASLQVAVHGVDGIFFMQTDPDPQQASNMIDAAHACGVERVVVLSSAGTVLHPLPTIGRRIARRDQVFAASDLQVTYLRANGLMSNALWWSKSILEQGRVVDATYPGRQAVVDPLDVARVGATALIEDGHAGKGYVLTGPEALDAKEQVETLSDVLGRTIDFVAESPEQGEQQAIASGTAPAMAAAMRDLNELFAASRAGIVTDDISNLTGAPPRSFRGWCEEHRSTFTDR